MSLTGPLVDYGSRVTSLLGSVGDQEINVLADQLLRLDTARQNPITLYLSCSGGSLVDGLKLADIMAGLRSPVTAVALGLIEGAGIVILG